VTTIGIESWTKNNNEIPEISNSEHRDRKVNVTPLSKRGTFRTLLPLESHPTKIAIMNATQ
jgi:hypothetical protein